MILRACKKCGVVQAVTDPMNPPTHNCPVCDYRLFVELVAIAAHPDPNHVVAGTDEAIGRGEPVTIDPETGAAEKAKPPKGPKA